MTNHLVKALEGDELDRAVAKALGGVWCPPLNQYVLKEHAEAINAVFEGESGVVPKADYIVLVMPWSRDFDDGGQIIEREGIATWKAGKEWCAKHPKDDKGGWYDETSGTLDVRSFEGVRGPTLLVAAMRAFVRAKLGKEVELP